MRNITKKYLVWNYSAVIVLSIVMIIIILGRFGEYHLIEEDCVFIMIWSVIWVCIVPMFVGNLAKAQGFNAKFWFGFSIITTILPIIVAIICLASKYDPPSGSWGQGNYEQMRKAWESDMISLNRTVYISGLLPGVSFLAFWLYRFFSGLDWSNADGANTTVYETQVNSSHICPHCNSPIDADAVFCENCGNKI